MLFAVNEVLVQCVAILPCQESRYELALSVTGSSPIYDVEQLSQYSSLLPDYVVLNLDPADGTCDVA